jgi:hypothetical protein
MTQCEVLTAGEVALEDVLGTVGVADLSIDGGTGHVGNHAHMSGTSIDAQVRYANGTKDILESYFSGREDYRPEENTSHCVMQGYFLLALTVGLGGIITLVDDQVLRRLRGFSYFMFEFS